MEQRKLRAYFHPSPLWAKLLIGIGIGLLALLILSAPGTGAYQEVNRRVIAVFADELGMKASHVEVYLILSYILLLGLALFGLIFSGAVALGAYRHGQSFTDAEVDALLVQRMSQLPGALETRHGLPGRGAGDDLLVLWAPRPEDRVLLHPLDRKERKKLKSLAGRFAVGKDQLVRCARLDVLVLEKRNTMLYILDGFYDLIEMKVTGEAWGEYRLEHARAVKEDADHGRVALLMEDGFQYEVVLLTGKESARLSKDTAYPLIVLEEAGGLLRQFCQIQDPAQALQVEGLQPGAQIQPQPPPDQAGGLPQDTDAGDATQPEAAQGRLGELEAELRSMCQGDQELMERLIAHEQREGHGQAREAWVEAAIYRWQADNR